MTNESPVNDDASTMLRDAVGRLVGTLLRSELAGIRDIVIAVRSATAGGGVRSGTGSDDLQTFALLYLDYLERLTETTWGFRREIERLLTGEIARTPPLRSRPRHSSSRPPAAGWPACSAYTTRASVLSRSSSATGRWQTLRPVSPLRGSSSRSRRPRSRCRPARRSVWASFLWHVRLDLKVTEGFAKRRHRHSSRSNRRRSVSTATESESMTVVVVVTTRIRSSGAKGLSSPEIETS